ncbi:MAG TPA: 16S rRNA (cytosine(1402)-N(4))-methyltransferase RsmH [Acidobacteriaceae bacterium]|nr:16S rRNA (cytosine(1402)-N(4))-methyltransferase RsmH [Acidobacteriaceae bacterium]
MTSDFTHVPVLLPQVLESLQPRPGGAYIDATLGAAGHAEAVLARSSPSGRLLGIDADPAALAAARRRLEPFGDRAILVESYFDNLLSVAQQYGFDPSDGILFDLGVSSPQLDQPERGFSFQTDAPLDMRFGPTAQHSAADLIAELPQDELRRIFSEYGEERYSGRIARHIVEERQRAPILTTRQLATLVARSKPGTEHINPATRIFQALRIAVNDELGRLQAALPQALQILAVGGRLAVISFHSLEDRIVKQFMRREARDCVCPPDLPQCICGHKATLRILTPRPIAADESETRNNPRARSAKLRVAEKIAVYTATPLSHAGEGHDRG